MLTRRWRRRGSGQRGRVAAAVAAVAVVAVVAVVAAVAVVAVAVAAVAAVVVAGGCLHLAVWVCFLPTGFNLQFEPK